MSHGDLCAFVTAAKAKRNKTMEHTCFIFFLLCLLVAYIDFRLHSPTEVITTWTNMEEITSVKLLFEENPADEALSAADVLLKIANNILNNPDNQKYRTLKVENAVVSSKLLPVSGAMECLFEMGFELEEVNKTVQCNSSLA